MKHLSFLLLLVILSANLLADEIKLEKWYVGGLYINQNQRVYARTDAVGVRAAIWTSFPMPLGVRLHAIGVYKGSDAGLGAGYFQKSFSSKGFVRLGTMTKPIRFLNCPSTVSDAGHFQALSKVVIYGLSNGMLFNYQNFYLGEYIDEGNKPNANFGWKKKVGPVDISLAGLYGQYKTQQETNPYGWSVKLEKSEKFEVMYFNQSGEEYKTQSLALSYNLPRKSGLYASLVYEKQRWRQMEVGAYKYYSQIISEMEVNYMICVAYLYSEVKPPSFNFYFQTWL